MKWEVYVNEAASAKRPMKVYVDETGTRKLLREEHFALVAKPDWSQPYDGPGEVFPRENGDKIFLVPSTDGSDNVRKVGPLTEEHVVTLRDGRVGCNTLTQLHKHYAATGLMWDDNPDPAPPVDPEPPTEPGVT